MTHLLNWLRRRWKWLRELTKKTIYGTTPIAPRLMIIGAQKSGTTSLFHYLSHHPSIVPPRVKELNYFNSFDVSDIDEAEYHSQFPYCYGKVADQISLDASPSYMLDATDVAAKIYRYNANMKFLVCLREPVSRAVSAWFMYRKLHSSNPDWYTESAWVKHRSDKNQKPVRRKLEFGMSFAEDIQEEIDVLVKGGRIDMPIVEYGLYEQQLRPFYENFGKDKILVISNEDLANKTLLELGRVIDFLGIPEFEWQKEHLIKHFIGDNKEPIEDFELDALKLFYEEKNRGLELLTGKVCPWNRV